MVAIILYGILSLISVAYGIGYLVYNVKQGRKLQASAVGALLLVSEGVLLMSLWHVIFR